MENEKEWVSVLMLNEEHLVQALSIQEVVHISRIVFCIYCQ